MSVIVAIKENDIVYMGADTQSTAGDYLYRIKSPIEYKIQRLENGMLVGLCGSKSVAQQLVAQSDVFTLDENGTLSRGHIVRNIIPTIKKIVGQRSEEFDANSSVLLVYKDKIYQINSDGDLIKHTEYVSIGSGLTYTYYTLFDRKDLPVRERMIMALNASSKRVDSVSAPYTLIDTQNMEYETVNEKGEKLC